MRQSKYHRDIPNDTKVTKHTRAGQDGKMIYCPDCNTGRIAYHFSWCDSECDKCKRMVAKEDYLLEPKVTLEQHDTKESLLADLLGQATRLMKMCRDHDFDKSGTDVYEGNPMFAEVAERFQQTCALHGWDMGSDEEYSKRSNGMTIDECIMFQLDSASSKCMVTV